MCGWCFARATAASPRRMGTGPDRKDSNFSTGTGEDGEAGHHEIARSASFTTPGSGSSSNGDNIRMQDEPSAKSAASDPIAHAAFRLTGAADECVAGSRSAIAAAGFVVTILNAA